MKPQIVLFGSGPFGLPAFQRLVEANRFDIVGIVTQPPKPVGRHHTVTPTPVHQWAEHLHLPVMTPTSWRKSTEPLTELQSWKPDLVIVASYGLILPENLLSVAPRGNINIHGSLLPALRGASPIASALLHGYQQTGVTFMLMDAGLDTGEMLASFPIDIDPQDTTVTLGERLAQLAGQHLVQVVDDWLAGRLLPQPQDDQAATLTKKITAADAHATWTSAAEEERKIRAYTPWPCVWTLWKGQRVKIISAHLSTAQSSAAPGTVLSGSPWSIATANGTLIPDMIQFEGKRPVSASTVPGSYPDFIGSILG